MSIVQMEHVLNIISLCVRNKKKKSRVRGNAHKTRLDHLWDLISVYYKDKVFTRYCYTYNYKNNYTQNKVGSKVAITFRKHSACMAQRARYHLKCKLLPEFGSPVIFWMKYVFRRSNNRTNVSVLITVLEIIQKGSKPYITGDFIP